MAQKGFGLLVNALERWNESRPHRPLHVCCFGWGGFIREEQADIKRRGLADFFISSRPLIRWLPQFVVWMRS